MQAVIVAHQSPNTVAGQSLAYFYNTLLPLLHHQKTHHPANVSLVFIHSDAKVCSIQKSKPDISNTFLKEGR